MRQYTYEHLGAYTSGAGEAYFRDFSVCDHLPNLELFIYFIQLLNDKETPYKSKMKFVLIECCRILHAMTKTAFPAFTLHGIGFWPKHKTSLSYLS